MDTSTAKPGGGDKARHPALQWMITVDEWVGRVEGVLVVAGLSVMLLLYFLYVVFRNVSASLGEKWLSELPLQLVLWVSLFGTSIAAQQGRHIGIDLVSRLLPKTALRVVRVLTSAVATGMATLLSVAGWRYLFSVEIGDGENLRKIAVAFGETQFFSSPTWIFVAVVPIAFGLTAWHFLVLTVREAAGDSPFPDEADDEAEVKAVVDAVTKAVTGESPDESSPKAEAGEEVAS